MSGDGQSGKARDSAAAKELVQRWFSVGIASPEGQAMLTDDFKWISPKSMAEIIGTEDGVLRGRESLPYLLDLDRAQYSDYDDAERNPSAHMNHHFMIAEGDIVVSEFDARFTTHDGQAYHNQYVLVIILRGDKICEVRDHVDSHYSMQAFMGTPEKRAGMLERLARVRKPVR